MPLIIHCRVTGIGDARWARNLEFATNPLSGKMLFQVHPASGCAGSEVDFETEFVVQQQDRTGAEHGAGKNLVAGDRRRATEWLSLAVDRGFINYPFLVRHDPIPSGPRGYAAYDRLLQRVRRAWEDFPGR